MITQHDGMEMKERLLVKPHYGLTNLEFGRVYVTFFILVPLDNFDFRVPSVVCSLCE